MQQCGRPNLNKNTVTGWYLAFRELVACSLRVREQKIGGPGVIVQVDETKLGTVKYHRGHRWRVFGWSAELR